MVAAKDNRYGAGGKDFAHSKFNIPVTLDCVGMDNIGIPDIDNFHRPVRQIGDVVFVIIGPGMAE